ncbi:MAG: sugar phosphate nucleotidyltransferase, partial [Candidatus Caldarchaeum sp.]
GMRLTYVWDREDAKGTCGALLNALRENAFTMDDTLLIYYGDILTNLSLSELVEQHTREKAIATLAVSPRYQLPVGVATIENNRVTEMREKPFININVTIGLLILEAKALAYAENASDIMSDLIPRLIEKKEKVAAYVTEAFWYDVGSTEKYEKLTHDIVEKYLEGLHQTSH